MIEREFIAQKAKEFALKQFVERNLPKVGISKIKLKKIPLGEKIVIYTSRPSLIVGSRGSNIKDLTRTIKKKFKLENPQIEINEVKQPFLDAAMVAQRIVSSLERFGSARFKSVGHRIIENVMNSGALGVEIVLSGKIPGARAKSWRFYQGYLKKCGEVALEGVQRAQARALLKAGIIGVKVAIMPPDVVLPDRIILVEPETQAAEAVVEVPKEESKPKKRIRKKKEKVAEKAEKATPVEVQAVSSDPEKDGAESVKEPITETTKETGEAA